jgi:hypothetical protein
MEGEPMTADERRLLELLAAAEDGATDPLLRAHADDGAGPDRASGDPEPAALFCLREKPRLLGL